jgi:hypothetical protein
LEPLKTNKEQKEHEKRVNVNNHAREELRKRDGRFFWYRYDINTLTSVP